jgi:flavin reductase (DIM6/NTAB) family NADH-FMN oxidoreductase RutF
MMGTMMRSITFDGSDQAVRPPGLEDSTAASFTDVMAALPGGVALVTCRDADGTPRGLTTTAVCSLSASPPQLLVCLDRSSRTLPALLRSGAFAVNFVGAGAADLCRVFASKVEDKFAGVSWSEGPLGVPVLDEAATAWACCAIERTFPSGDHIVVVGAYQRGAAQGSSVDPLIYYRRRFGGWAEAAS